MRSSARPVPRPRPGSSTRSRPTVWSRARDRPLLPDSPSPAGPPEASSSGPRRPTSCKGQRMQSDNKRKVARLTRDDSEGPGFGSALKAALTPGGATVVANDAYDPSSSDFHGDVAKIVGKGADAVVVIGFNDDGAKVLKE